MKDWELQESSSGDQQWQLLDAEQELPEELRLTDDPSAEVPDWQPLRPEDRPEPGSGRSWLLSLLIIFAMLAVVGYIAWLGLGGAGFGSFFGAQQATPVPTDEPVVAVVDTPEPAQEVAPTAPPAQEPTATATLAPTATATPFLIDQETATVNSPAGLNVREAPDANAPVITIAEDGLSFTVTDETEGWVQIVLPDGRAGWVSTDFVEIAVTQVPAPPGLEPTATPAAVASEDTSADAPAITESIVITTGVLPPEPFSAVVPAGPAVIVRAVDGVNARSLPSLDGEVLIIVPQGAALPATEQSDDGQWYQVTLPNGDAAWMFAEAVEASNVDALTAPPAAADTAPPVIETQTVTTTAAVTDTAATGTEQTGTAPSDAAPVDVVATVVIDNLIGFQARTAPRTDADTVEFLDGGSEWPAVGRNEAGDWVQVELGDGSSAWVHFGTVLLNVPVESLPVSQP